MSNSHFLFQTPLYMVILKRLLIESLFQITYLVTTKAQNTWVNPKTRLKQLVQNFDFQYRTSLNYQESEPGFQTFYAASWYARSVNRYLTAQPNK